MCVCVCVCVCVEHATNEILYPLQKTPHVLFKSPTRPLQLILRLRAAFSSLSAFHLEAAGAPSSLLLLLIFSPSYEVFNTNTLNLFPEEPGNNQGVPGILHKRGQNEWEEEEEEVVVVV